MRMYKEDEEKKRKFVQAHKEKMRDTDKEYSRI